jgi:DNA-binding XRE family transcriptional regulator
MYGIIKQKREQLGMTMYRAAKLTGLHQSTIKNLEAGKGDNTSLYKYMEVLNLKLKS